MPELADDILVLRKQLDTIMQSGCYSNGFLIDLAMLTRRNLDPAYVVAELRVLEGLPGFTSSTKPSSRFEREPLKGYWHKHHQQTAYMTMNILLETRRDNTVINIISRYSGQAITRVIINELISAFTFDNYLRRVQEGRITGEWIIYSQSDEQNYCITAASHSEGDDVTAEHIHRYEAIDKTAAWKSQEKRDLVIKLGPTI